MNCEDCHGQIPASFVRCPHCARPGLFPNHRAACDPVETAALNTRYQAIRDAATPQQTLAIHRFEKLVSSSSAVVSRPVEEVLRLATGSEQMYATYYGLIAGGVRMPSIDGFDSLRRVADEALFPGYGHDIVFGGLSLDGTGLPHYGGCALELKDDYISHRASVLEQNSVTFLSHHAIQADLTNLPAGYRAPWGDRARLAVAKLGQLIQPAMTEVDFQNLLVRPGATGSEDDFIEVHVWGSFTLEAIRRVTMRTPRRRPDRMSLFALREKLAKRNQDTGLEVEVRLI